MWHFKKSVVKTEKTFEILGEKKTATSQAELLKNCDCN